MNNIDAKYLEWIDQYVNDVPALLGRCKEACALMIKAFPELKEVRGHVWVPAWGKRGHAWLKDMNGNIIDPTADQFPGIAEYEAWNPGDECRVGKCMNCGDDIWKPLQTLDEDPGVYSICSDECEKEMMMYLKGELYV